MEGAWDTGRKQARRTGMAGPLGEMFDHGASRLFVNPDVFVHPSSRMRCPQYHSECILWPSVSSLSCALKPI